jgi:hypothetical protein
MATYKVIQDIEAEDKLVGPLTLRQFIYAGVAAVCLYICFLALSKGTPFLIGIFLPVAVGAGFFGFPWKGEQPTEIWALARVRFMLKPRVRIWDQDGVKDLVRVIAPKVIPVRRSYKDNMTQTEVRSRLKALADTIDSRGWATRNAAYGYNSAQWSNPNFQVPGAGAAQMFAAVPNDDMFDDQGTVAQNFDAMLNRSQAVQRQRVLDRIDQVRNPQPQQPAAIQPAPYGQTYGYAQPAAPQMPMPAAANNAGYWFASGPAYPTYPQSMAQQPAAMMAPPPANYAAPSQPAALMPSLPAPILPAPSMPAAAPQPYEAPQPTADFDIPVAPVMSSEAPPAPTPAAFPMPAPIAAEPAPIPVPPAGSYSIESDAPLTTAATPTAEETAMAADIKQQNRDAMAINYGHMRVLQPSGPLQDSMMGGNASGAGPIDYSSNAGQPAAPSAMPDASNAPVTHPPNPAILELANNDDLDVATIARQANRQLKKSPDEVEIRLH